MFMSLIKWEPFDDFERIFRDMSLTPATRMSDMHMNLACDIYEDGNNLIAEMNLPGMKDEDINIEVKDDRLRVSGEREEVNEKKEKDHYAKEIRRGSFDRVIPLPNAVERDQVEATYEDGVLKVVMPKKMEEDGDTTKVKIQK